MNFDNIDMVAIVRMKEAAKNWCKNNYRISEYLDFLLKNPNCFIAGGFLGIIIGMVPVASFAASNEAVAEELATNNDELLSDEFAISLGMEALTLPTTPQSTIQTDPCKNSCFVNYCKNTIGIFRYYICMNRCVTACQNGVKKLLTILQNQ